MSDLTPKQKRLARIITLQAIYAKELKGSNLDDTCEFMLNKDNPPKKNIVRYGKYLSNLIFKHSLEMDNLIKNRSKNWDFDFKRMRIIEIKIMVIIPVLMYFL